MGIAQWRNEQPCIGEGAKCASVYVYHLLSDRDLKLSSESYVCVRGSARGTLEAVRGTSCDCI